MFGFSWIKVAAAALVFAALSSAVAYVYSLRATIAEQRTAITETMAALQVEHRTAEHNGEMVRKMGELRAVEAESRKRLQATLDAERKKTLTRVQEIQRAPTANDPLPAAFDSFLRRLQ